MSSTNTKINILLEHIILAINEMKGKEIITLDLQKIDTSVCKYFIICTGNSNTHVNAIESNIKKIISREIGDKPYGVEGTNKGEWILMDYDYKTNLLKYEIDNEKIVKGEQNLKIVVMDKLNNKTVLNKKFIY